MTYFSPNLRNPVRNEWLLISQVIHSTIQQVFHCTMGKKIRLSRRHKAGTGNRTGAARSLVASHTKHAAKEKEGGNESSQEALNEMNSLQQPSRQPESRLGATINEAPEDKDDPHHQKLSSPLLCESRFNEGECNDEAPRKKDPRELIQPCREFVNDTDSCGTNTSLLKMSSSGQNKLLSARVVGDRVIVQLDLSQQEYCALQQEYQQEQRIQEPAPSIIDQESTSAQEGGESWGSNNTNTSPSGAATTQRAPELRAISTSTPVSRAATREQSTLRFNNSSINIDAIESTPIDFDAFRVNHGDGSLKSPAASRQAHHRARSNIVGAITKAGSRKQQALALHSASLHPSVRGVAKTAGFLGSKLDKTEAYHWHQIRAIVKEASSTATKSGRVNADKSLFLENLLTAIAPDSTTDTVTPSITNTSKALGIPMSTVGQKLKAASKKRDSLILDGDSAKWSRPSKRRRGFTKVTPTVRAAVSDWVKNHPNVIHSPIANDTLLVKVLGEEQKRRVGKLLLEIPVRELHCLMMATLEEGGLAMARDENGKSIISDTTLRNIIKYDIPQLKKATDRHKQMCGCETCITIASHQKSLNAWRFRCLRSLEAKIKTACDGSEERHNASLAKQDYKSHVFTETGEPIHPKPRHALESIMCKPLDCGYNHWNCVLRRLSNLHHSPRRGRRNR